MNILTNVFKRCEIILNSNKTYKNPFMDVEINAAFTHEDGTVITRRDFGTVRMNGKFASVPISRANGTIS